MTSPNSDDTYSISTDKARGHGLGKRLVTRIVTDPELASLQRLVLGTRDAHTLYAT